MAKIRRIIRKIETPHEQTFDEQLWPVDVALIVLGGFSVGVSLAYQRFDDPRWYANALTYVIAIPILVGAAMAAVHFTNNRAVRRSMQLAIVLSAIAHLFFLIASVETRIFSSLMVETKSRNELTDRRPPVKVPEYSPSMLVPEEEREPEEFEKPVETETPETTQPVLERTEQPETVSPRTPQPVPIQESVPTITPNVTKREEKETALPREAETPSKLSKQTVARDLTPAASKAESVATKEAPSTPSPPAPKAAAVARRTTETANEKAEPTEPVAAATPQPTNVAARRTDQPAPTPESTAQAVMKRAVNQPAITPKSQVDAADAPAVAKRTIDTEPTPANTQTVQRATAGSTTQRPEVEPTLEVTAQPTPTTKRELQAAPETAVAQAAVPSTNRQPRLTPRPNVAASAEQSPAPVAATKDLSQPGPQSTAVARAPSATIAEKTATKEAAAPNSPDTSTVASRVTRTESKATPNDPTLSAAANAPSRRTGTPGVATSGTKAEATAVAQSSNTAGDLAAQSTAARRTAVESAAMARAVGQPTPDTAAAVSPSATASATPSRAVSDSPTPAVGQVASATPTTGRSTAANSLNVVTRAASVDATSGPTASNSLQPTPSTALVSRQNAANSASATQTQPSLNAPSAVGVGASTAGGGIVRATSNSAASINPEAPASGAPQRTNRIAQATASPTNVENPTTSTGAAGDAEPTAQASKLAMSRSQSGTAGLGNSPNLDRGTAAGDSPALTASTAARREAATSAGPPDAALTPSTVAARAHSRAASELPTASVQAQAIQGGSEGGATQLAEVTAGASASVTRATSNAAAGEVSAAKGTADIDVGATTIVAESGQSRAAGGGQPEMSFDPQSGAIARQQSSAAAQPSLAAATNVADIPNAPAASGGGQAASLDPSNTLAVRGTGAASGSVGGPSKAEQQGPLAEPSVASIASQTVASRAEASAGGTPGAGGAPDFEDEEEKAKRLARAASGGSPQISAAATQVADVPVVPTGDGGSGGALASGSPAPANTAAARAAQAGGAAVGGGLPAVGDESTAAVGTASASVPLARAENAAAAESPNASIGGGTDKPTRASGGQTIATASQAETIQLAGAEQSGGAKEGVSLQAQGIAAAKTSGGAPSAYAQGAVGAAAGEVMVDSIARGAVGSAPGRRVAGSGEGTGPTVVAVGGSGGSSRSVSTAAFTAADSGSIEVPLTGETSAVAQADLDHGSARTSVTRSGAGSGSGLVVQIEAPEGVGGLGKIAASQVGLSTRLSRADSVEFTPQASRFVDRNRSRGLPSVSVAAVVPTESFKQRAEGRKGSGVRLPPQTETAIEMGLQFLSRYQQPDGSWRLQGMEQNVDQDPLMVSDTAATAMAVLAFQGAGYNHREHKYAVIVRNGLDHLVRNQKENGDLFVPLDDQSNRSVWLYSHALAALALTEAYGMSQDPDLLQPAQKAIDFIVKAQHAERGGWRYSPGIGSDTSVTGAMLVTLRSAQLAGLNVPESTFEKVRHWLDLSQASQTQPHLYRYNPYAPDTTEQRHGRQASPTMSSLGMLMRLYLGWRRDNPNMANGAEYLKLNLPAVGTVTDPQRDTYYWYYATQVMYHMGGDYWKQWHDNLHKLLTESQVKDGPMAGSWNPRLPVADRWGPHGGRLFVTTLNLLSLEVQYRYLPTYEDTAK